LLTNPALQSDLLSIFVDSITAQLSVFMNRLVLVFFLFFHLNSFSQTCYHNGCSDNGTFKYATVRAVNYSKKISANTDLTFDLAITLPACMPTYTGDVVILRMPGVPPLKYLDTISTTIYSGQTTVIPSIVLPYTILQQGFQNQDSIVNAIDVIFKDDPNCSSPSYLDPAPADDSKWISVHQNVTSVTNALNETLHFYFSPDHSVLHLTNTNFYQEVIICSIYGEILYKEKVSEAVDVSKLASGCYLIYLLDSAGMIVRSDKIFK